ncbi:MAG: penicillin-binding protein 2 [Chloroflexia bacterium]
MKRSFRAFNIVIVLMFCLLAGQLYRMQVIDGQRYSDQAKGNRERIVTRPASRGVIYDRNGKRLVVNNPSYSVTITPADLPDNTTTAGKARRDAVFAELASILGTHDVIAVTPKKLPLDKMGEVANRLSVLLQVPAETLRPSLKKIMEDAPASEKLFLFRSDLTPQQSAAVRSQLQNLPGVDVYNELEFNFVTHFERWLSPVTVKRGVTYETMVRVDVAGPHLPGVLVVPEPVRQYISGPLFSHLLGYVGPIDPLEYDAAQNNSDANALPVYDLDDKVGKTGLEAALEEQLRGTKGAARLVVNSNERVVSELESTAPITGNNVTLSLDSALQVSVTNALQDGLTKAGVSSGVAIVLRVNDGQVLSMVSLPSYDNNLFSTGISQPDFDRLNNDPKLPMFDRAVGGAYPPGSTYKMITASAALQEGIVKPDTTVACPAYIEVPTTWNEKLRNRFRDWKAGGHGTINIVQALTVSSDVFFYIMAGPHQQDDRGKYTRYYAPYAGKPTEFNGLGIDKINKYAIAYGFGHKTGIELPGEVPGIAPNPKWKIDHFPDNPWSIGDTIVTAIGQGYNTVTPLQLVNVTAAVANGGTLYQPQLVQRITEPSGRIIQDFQPKVLGHVPISPENLAVVREGMRQVVADKRKGTAYRMTLSSIAVAGKTGTAEFGEELKDPKGHAYKRSHAWFTAFAPYDKPEIAVVVLLEGGTQSLEGSTFAVPITDNILKAYFHVTK